MKTRRQVLGWLSGLIGLSIASAKAHSSVQLSREDIARAWEDPEFRSKLTEEQWNALPPNPAGEISSGEHRGNFHIASGNFCSGNNCSGNNCSGNNCSGNNCSSGRYC